jgi:hypothetical protein
MLGSALCVLYTNNSPIPLKVVYEKVHVLPNTNYGPSRHTDYGKLHVLPNANDGPGRHAASRGDIQPLYLLAGTRNTLVPAHSTTQC